MADKSKLSDYRLEFAATIFIRECLRQWHKMHPNTEPPMKMLCDYPKREQLAIKRAVEKSFEAATGMDDLYRIFLEDKLKNTQEPPRDTF